MAFLNSRSQAVGDLCLSANSNPIGSPEEVPNVSDKLNPSLRNDSNSTETHANNDLDVNDSTKAATISPLRITNTPADTPLKPTSDIVKVTDSSSSADQKRPLEELIKLVKQEKFDPTSLSNEEIIELMLAHQVSVRRLESILGRSNAKRCVEIRRQYYCKELELLDKLEDYRDKSTARASALKPPVDTDFDYERVVGACCENVIGCVRTPVGFAGPLKLDNQLFYVPMATTEGCLVASTSRGLSALAKSGGVTSRVRKDRMTRAPIVTFRDPDPIDALKNVDKALDWLEDPINKEKMKSAFRSTSKHITHVDYTLYPIDTDIHIRFEAQTGDAMGMNMCSKGAEKALKEMQRVFPTMDILTLSGNMCTDKKPSAINWIEGRGKSVQCCATIPFDIVQETFKVPVDSLIEVWNKKVMVGSAMAGSIGGFNCHAANIVSAIFLATGQDLAQNVTSSNCILQLKSNHKGALQVHCSMPSIECGTVGGGTVLPDQSRYLQLMGIKGSTPRRDQTSAESAPQNGQVVDTSPAKGLDSDTNACKLARIICATVMAAELSLLASLTEGTLVKSHMTHNRSTQPCHVV